MKKLSLVNSKIWKVYCTSKFRDTFQWMYLTVLSNMKPIQYYHVTIPEVDVIFHL